MSLRASPRVLWVEQRHSNLEYYDALRYALVRRGVNITDATHSRDKAWLSAPLASAQPVDAVLLGFGWMGAEPPLARDIRSLPEFSRTCGQPGANASAAAAKCLCGTVPFFVLLNKEYALMPQKFRWLQHHCVDAAFSVHHDVAQYEAASGVPFFRISFGADTTRFSRASTPSSSPLPVAVQHPASASSSPGEPADILVRGIMSRQTASAAAFGTPARRVGDEPLATASAQADVAVGQQELAAAAHTYEYDLGFTGVVRKDQTSNWRYHIWKQSWPQVGVPPCPP